MLVAPGAHHSLMQWLLRLPTAQAPSHRASADMASKLAYYAACGGDEHFPDFTGARDSVSMSE